jgi:hypothetical protein
VLRLKPIAVAMLALLVVASNAEAKKKPKPQRASIEGTISALGAVPGGVSITITNASKTETLFANASTDVEIHGDADATLADLAVGDAAKATYLVSNKLATEIEVKEPEDATATGTVTAADSATGVVTMEIPNGMGGTTTLTLQTDANTKLQIGDVDITQAQLGLIVGLTAKAEYDPVSFLASEIEADAHGALTATGQVTAVDPAAGTLTVQTASGPLTFTVLADTKIHGGDADTLAEIAVGDTVKVRYLTNAAGTNIALDVEVSPPAKITVTGLITAVDTAAGTLTVQTKSGSVTVTVNASTDLRINGKAATLPAVQQAMTDAQAAGRVAKVTVQYLDDAVKTAVRVQVNVQGKGRK